MKPKGRTSSKVLSKNVLQMKFMKKTALENQEKIAEEENKQIDNEHWYVNMPNLEVNKNNISIEKSYTIFNNIGYGRLSFQGFNPEIEKIMQNKLGNGDDNIPEISAEDIELAEYYEKHYKRNKRKKTNNNIKFQNGDVDLENAMGNCVIKNKEEFKSKAKKRKFIKPNLDD